MEKELAQFDLPVWRKIQKTTQKYPYMGKNDFVGSNEHIPWVLCIKLHLKMPGVDQLQISPLPYLKVHAHYTHLSGSQKLATQ